MMTNEFGKKYCGGVTLDQLVIILSFGEITVLGNNVTTYPVNIDVTEEEN